MTTSHAAIDRWVGEIRCAIWRGLQSSEHGSSSKEIIDIFGLSEIQSSRISDCFHAKEKE